MAKILTREEIAKRFNLEKTEKNTVTLRTVIQEEIKDKKFQKSYNKECLRYEIANKISQSRKLQKISQVELAKQANTTQKIISHIENGEVSIGVNLLQKITDVLGLKIIIS